MRPRAIEPPAEDPPAGEAAAGAGAAEALERVGMLLDRAVRRLGDAGRPDEAARIAAEAWWLLRGPSPRCARRLNATLHYLTLGRPARQSSETRSIDDEER